MVALSCASPDAPGNDAVLYLVAKGGQPTANKGGGDNPAIALMTVLGSKPPAKVTINEMTTVASVWTHAQFLDGTAIKGHALGLQDRRRQRAELRRSRRPAAGATPFRTRSTAARRRRWPTSPRWPTCLPAASRG